LIKASLMTAVRSILSNLEIFLLIVSVYLILQGRGPSDMEGKFAIEGKRECAL